MLIKVDKSGHYDMEHAIIDALQDNDITPTDQPIALRLDVFYPDYGITSISDDTTLFLKLLSGKLFFSEHQIIDYSICISHCDVADTMLFIDVERAN